MRRQLIPNEAAAILLVVVAAAGVGMPDVITNDPAIVIIAANISAVAVVFLLRCVSSLASKNTMY